MDAYILGAPAGFAGTCLTINQLIKTSPAKFQELCRTAVLHITAAGATTSNSSSSGLTHEDAAVKAALEFIYAGASRYSITDPKLLATTLVKHTDMTQHVIEPLVLEYYGVVGAKGGNTATTSSSSSGSSNLIAPVPVRAPQLVGLDWSLGVTASSSASSISSSSSSSSTTNTTTTTNAASNNIGGAASGGGASSAVISAGRPFANVQLRIRYQDGSSGIESVEMTLPQLKLFEASLREAAEALDRA